MLNELKIDELLHKVDSRYGLVLVAARRSRQITEYAATLGLNRSQHPLSIAFEELRSDKLEVGFKRPPEEADKEDIGTPADAGDDYLNPAPGASPAPEAEAPVEEASDEGVA